MPFIVDDCPRCSAKRMTLDVFAYNFTTNSEYEYGGSVKCYELYCVCKSCGKGTIFNALQKVACNAAFESINWDYYRDLSEIAEIGRPISPADLKVSEPPEFLPPRINDAYNEGAKCLAIGCYNAAATMFRLCLDYATKELVSKGEQEPTSKVKRSLGLRMEWLFDNRLLPETLRELAECVKDDGNDGAHEGTLDKDAAEELEDFTQLLLERLYTEHHRLAEARARREERKQRLVGQ